MRLLPMASSPDGLSSARDAVITKTPGGGVLTTTSNVNVWGGGGEERRFAVGALALGVAGGGGPIPVSPARHRHTGFCSHAQAMTSRHPHYCGHPPASGGGIRNATSAHGVLP